MDICEHCHNVLPKSVDRCTVCGTERVDPLAADVRRREDGQAPSHAPGWAAPVVPDDGLHPDDFLRELSGGPEPSAPAAPYRPSASTPTDQRPTAATPEPGALAGYLGQSLDRTPEAPENAVPTHTARPELIDELLEEARPSGSSDARRREHHGEHLTTATHVSSDGVAARSTRLDGAVKLGPTGAHQLLSVGAPALAVLALLVGVFGAYQVVSGEPVAAEVVVDEVEQQADVIEGTSSAVIRLDLDGCGIVGQTTGFLFADQTILVQRSAILTDNRPTMVLEDGTVYPGVVVGWSITRDLAVVRAEERLSGGLRWGVSARSAEGDPVTILDIASPGAVEPVPAVIASTAKINGRNVSFELDSTASVGSLVISADGFVIGVVDGSGTAQAGDDVAPAMSRIVLDNERPAPQCPAPPTTLPPENEGENENENGNGNGNEGNPVDE